MKVDRIIQTLPSLSADQRDGVRQNAERWAATGTPEQCAAAAQVLDALAALEEAEHQAMVDRLSGMDVAQRVVEAFRAVPMTPTEEKLIQALLDHPAATSGQLSAALGWGGMSWHLHFGTLCFHRAVYLWPAPRAEKRNADFYSGILADFDDDGSRFTMKPAVVEAFAAMGIRARPG
jgi:hypothetical protein